MSKEVGGRPRCLWDTPSSGMESMNRFTMSICSYSDDDQTDHSSESTSGNGTYSDDEDDASTRIIVRENPGRERQRVVIDDADSRQPPPSHHTPNWQTPPNTGFQRHHIPSNYPWNGHYVQNPAVRGPPVPVHQHRGNFWEQFEHFETGAERQPGKSLVPTRTPCIPDTGEPSYPNPKRLEGPVANPTDPIATMGAGHGAKTDLQPPRPTYFPYPKPVAPEKPGARTHLPDKGPLREPLKKAEAPDATTRVDLVHDPSRANKDMSIRIALDAEEDWEDDLEEFCRLRRLGLIKEAKEQFWSALAHVNTMPYIRVQYAEMLQASGDFKGFQKLDFLPEFPPSPSEETPDDRSRGKLVANHALLDLLSQRPIEHYLTHAWGVIRHTLKALAGESTVGSTEIQLIVLCLRVLDYLKTCTHETVVGPAIVYANRLFNWRQLYHDLVGESCVWDFKDLFYASVSVFGWQEALVQFFGTTHFPRALDSIVQDWTRPFYDEASVMGLLDLFSSLILQDHGSSMKARNTLLLHHARTMAESAERNDPELMKTKPFVQWLLAKSVVDLENPPERPDGVRMEHFSGLGLNQGGGVHLPIYVPSRHSRKPDWDMFFSRSTPAQRRVVEVAVRAAEQLGDYNLQAEALKLLILQSQDPKQWMTALAHLQLETQGDKEGYLATCLSRYLVATDPAEETTLLKDLERHGGSGDALYFEQCENASLTWAWSMVRVLLTTAHGDDGSVATGETEPSPFLAQGFSLDGSKLPPYVAEFARVELGIFVTESMGPLSLADLKSTNVGGEEQVKHDQHQPDAALRARFARTTAEPAIGVRHPVEYELRGRAVNPANWPPWPPRSPSPPRPPRPPPTRPNPLDYYNDQQPNPLAKGVTKDLKVNGWPETWFKDAKQYAPRMQPRYVEDLDSDVGRPHRIMTINRGPDAEHQRLENIRKFDERVNNRRPVEILRMGRRHGSRERDILGGRDKLRERFGEADERGGRLGDKKHLSNTRLDRQRREREKSEWDRGQATVDDAGQERNGTRTTHKTPHKGIRGHKKREPRDREEEKSSLKEVDSLDDGYSSGGSDGPEDRLHVTVEDGVTKLYFPSGRLDGNGTTVVLNDHKHSRKPNTYVVGKGGDIDTTMPDRTRRRLRTASPPGRGKPEIDARARSPGLSWSSESAIWQRWPKSKSKKKGKVNEPRKSPFAAQVKTEDEADRQEAREYEDTDPLAPAPPPPPPAESEPKPGPKPADTDANDPQPTLSKEGERQTPAATTITAIPGGVSTTAAAAAGPKSPAELEAKPKGWSSPPPTIASTEPATAPVESATTAAERQADPRDIWADLWAVGVASPKKHQHTPALPEPKPKPEQAPSTSGDDIWAFTKPAKRKNKQKADESPIPIRPPTTAPGTADGKASEEPAQDPSDQNEDDPAPAPDPERGASTKPEQQPSNSRAGGGTVANTSRKWGATSDWAWEDDPTAPTGRDVPAATQDDDAAEDDDWAREWGWNTSVSKKEERKRRMAEGREERDRAEEKMQEEYREKIRKRVREEIERDIREGTVRDTERITEGFWERHQQGVQEKEKMGEEKASGSVGKQAEPLSAETLVGDVGEGQQLVVASMDKGEKQKKQKNKKKQKVAREDVLEEGERMWEEERLSEEKKVLENMAKEEKAQSPVGKQAELLSAVTLVGDVGEGQ
ncbi:uncharacterized protein B0H64DRAFT_472116 [Chaetomium fimeti]|uniref:Uncharacterized protein n=1 Tax=Chaetomium fimeti TaxID=1854472 RepID=A0AAE0LVC2_9PEZI|nr:hypothetical protein B0H64DRAFT_472116 [Chaetomium fimeti]